MGFDGFLVPDWAKPYVGWAVGMDWPEGDESGCYRLADACAASAKNVARMEGLVPPMGWGDGWDGDALKEHLEYVRRYADPVLVDLVDQLVKGALEFNEMGVQVEYTKRMIEVSVWFLIFQIGWLLVAAVGPWGSVSLAMIGPRVQLARLTIAQLGKKLLINAGLFGGLMGGMDLAVQASQSRRDHLDWAQIGTSAGMGALMGGFLTAFTGFFPTRSMWGLMGRSALASGATTAAPMLFSGEPIDWEMIMKGVTSGALGGADAHWASWGQGAHPIGDGPAGGRGGWGGGHGGPDASPGHVPGKGPDPFTPPVSDGYGPGVFGKSGMSEGAPLSAVKQGADHTGSHLTADPASSVPGKAGWPDGTTTQQAGHHAAQQTGQQTAHQTGHPAGQYADGPATTHTTLSGTGQPVPKPDVVPTSSIDSLINGPHAGDAPAASKPGVGPVNGPIVGAAAGLKVNWTGGNGSPGHLPPAFHSAAQGTVAPHVPGTGTHPGVPSSLHTSQIDALLHRPAGGADSGAHGGASAHSSETTAPAATTHSSAAREPASPFQILADPGLSGDGYIGHGVWGKYGAAGVLIKNVDEHGVPRYLLVQMGSVSPHVGKWQLPGGALDSKETAPQGAARELSEELGVDQAYLDKLKLTGSHVFEGSGGWTYTNLAAEGEMFSPKIDGYETVDAKWFTLPELAELANEGRLHPAFKNALPDVLALYDQPGTAVSTAADAAPKTAVADGHTQTAAADGPTNTVTTDGHTNTAAVDGHTKAGEQAGKVTSDPAGAVPDGKTGHPNLFLATGSYTPTSGSVHVTPPVDFGAMPPGHVRAALPDGSVLPLKGLSAEASKAFGETLRNWGSGLFYVGPPPHVTLDAPFGARLVDTSFGDAVWGGTVKAMPEGVRQSVETYTGSGYRPINGYLRDSAFFEKNPDHTGMSPEERRAQAISHIERLNEATNLRMVPDTIDVFRALHMAPDLFSVPIHELPGTVQRDPAFMSTNIGKAAVWDYHPVILHLRVPEGTPALYVKAISKHGSENELLLGNGRAWFAEDVVKRDDQWHIYGWVLPDDGG